MKKAAACLALIPSILLFTAPLLQATEQKIIFNTKSIEYKTGTGSMRCRDRCNKKSDPDAALFLSKGWKILSSSPKEVIGEEYRYVPCNTCEPHGCTCIGTEYTLQRDDPPPKAETPSNERDLLKNENDALKQEITLLKQEIEKLKNQIKSEQKK